MLDKVKPAFQLKDPNLFRQQCYIDGAWVDADDKATLAVYNPADGQQIGTVPKLGEAETRRAIEAANAALPAWRAKTAKERSAILRKWFDLMMANQEDLAILMTVEQGKPLAESRGEIAYGASFIEWFAEEAKRVYGDTIPSQSPDRRIVVIKQPIGVCAAVTPWNFPNAMITRKAGPGARRRLHDGDQARVDDAVFGARAVRARRARGHPQRRDQRRDRFGRPDRRGAHDEPDRAQVHVHRLDRGRQAADGAVREHGEESVARARRQRAVHRVRRRRSRFGGRRRDGVEIPQHRPDLRVREPPVRAGRRLRRVREEVRRQGRRR